MRYGLIDRIVELDRGKRIVAVRAVTLAEEYLADHFPTFPVLPGVLMLEALAEAAAWLVRDAQSFVCGVVLLREAKNVTYKNFVRPGEVLRLEVGCRRLERDESDFEGAGFSQGREVVRARLGLRHFPVGQSPWGKTGESAPLVQHLRARFALLRG